MLGDNTFSVIFGSIVGLIGVAYVVLEFVPSIEPPQNMRYASPSRVSRNAQEEHTLTSCSK